MDLSGYAGADLISLIGGLRAGWWGRVAGRSGLGQARRRVVVLTLLVLLIGYANLVLFNLRVAFQPQSRYVFVALAPAVLLLVLGLYYAGPRALINRLFVGALIGLFGVMQVLSLPILLRHWACWGVSQPCWLYIR